jgi:sugar phosphate isomerase/epimerase
MKLSTSTGDFSFYVETVPEKVRLLRETKFKYVNLEQTGNTPFLLCDSDKEYKTFAEECRSAEEFAGVRYVLSHAPCLHFAIPEALKDRKNEEYRRNLRAIIRSVEVCRMLGIARTVVHACVHESFSQEDFLEYNKAFYSDILEASDRYGVIIMTENWDNDGSHFSTGRQMREFIDEIDHPLFGACWDTAHGNIAHSARNIGQYENIIALGDKLFGMHVSDNFGDVHHHSWPFAGIINFDEVMQGLIDVGYDGYFNYEASYTLLHHKNIPYHRQPFEYRGKTVTKLLDPPIALKQRAVDLLYDIGRHILESYGAFEE